MPRISVIGLGAMGRPIAHNLLGAGSEVTVWNRSPRPVEELVAAGATAAPTLAEAFATGTVISMVSNDEVFAQLFLDSDVLAHAPADSVHINMATVSTELARRAAAVHAEHGVGYLSAPVFGRVAAAEAGRLTVIVGGPAALRERVQPVFDVIGASSWPMGERAEQASIVKILGNYLIACAIQSMGEAVSLAERSGVDAAELITLLSSTLFQGPAYASYGALIAAHEYTPAGFTTTLGRKDLHLALDVAERTGVTLPVGEVLRRAFDQAIADGRADEDWASIAEQQQSATGPR
ncbi:NAD(P)-dependent oxidoreductase [Mycetocola reblochoni]|uniref:NAD(P)-dependent oxidoreductase n=1 Tax=Mycetocola reblochoni TaxID=331618 RepID=UPI003F9C9333